MGFLSARARFCPSPANAASGPPRVPNTITSNVPEPRVCEPSYGRKNGLLGSFGERASSTIAGPSSGLPSWCPWRSWWLITSSSSHPALVRSLGGRMIVVARASRRWLAKALMRQSLPVVSNCPRGYHSFSKVGTRLKHVRFSGVSRRLPTIGAIRGVIRCGCRRGSRVTRRSQA
jgi:hypothetical protein